MREARGQQTITTGVLALALAFLLGSPQLGLGQSVELTPVTNGFAGLVDIVSAGDDRLFLVEQDGEILIWSAVVLVPTPFVYLTALKEGMKPEDTVTLPTFRPRNPSAMEDNLQQNA